MEAQREITAHITVLRGKRVRGSRDACVSLVRVEFNGCVLGDSQKVDVAVDGDAVYNFSCSFEISEAAQTLDDLTQKPVVLTVFEVLPKEKKQKEERAAAVGQAVLDLLPLLQGECSFSCSLQLHAVPGSPADVPLQEDRVTPTLDVCVSVQEPLLSDVQISESNVLMVTMETAYSVPDSWNAASSPPCSYVAALQIPLTAAKEQALVFSNGSVKMGGERESVPRPKKWPVGPLLAPGAEVMQGQFIDTEPMDTDHGDFTSPEDREFRADVEYNRKRVCWDTVRRCFIDAGGVACLSRRIAECRLWPIEIMRCPQKEPAKAGKTSKEKQVEEEVQISCHGVVYMDLAPLLYPGVHRIHGAYSIYPFHESDILTKAQRTSSVLKEQSRTPAVVGRTRASSSVDSLKAVQSKIIENHRAFKKGDAGHTDGLSDGEVNTEGQMYADSRSYIVIEVTLEKPLVPKRAAEELAKRVMELVPPRPPLPRRAAGAERAVQEFHCQVAGVVAQLLLQYQQMFGAVLVPGGTPADAELQEQRKAQLIAELNCSGKYFTFKEQMKHSVVRIVREKMLRTEAFSDPEQLQAFLTQLYVFLVDEMHAALNKTLSVDSPDAHAETQLSCSQLKLFSREAELTSQHQLAAEYHQECLIRDSSDPSHWFDYGVFHMLMAEHIKAEECFQHALSVRQTHTPSVLMCGVLAEMGGRYADAEVFFERATALEPSSVIAWTLYGLFCQSQDNSIQAEMAFLEANKQLRSVLQSSPACVVEKPLDPQNEKKHQQDNISETPAEEPEASGGDVDASPVDEENRPQISQESKQETHNQISPSGAKTTIYMEAVRFLLQNHALQMAQRALALQLLSPDRASSSSYHLALAQLQLLRGEHNSAEQNLREALTDDFQNADIWALWGHLHYMRGDFAEAQSCYERTLDSVQDASDTHSIYLRLGSIYLQHEDYEKAKATFLRACRSSSSCLTWLGLGTACYRLDELSEAEDALTEANALNNRNAEVWGFLSLVCLRSGRKLEAEQSYKYAVKMNLQKESLLQEIKDLQTRVGFGNPCF